MLKNFHLFRYRDAGKEVINVICQFSSQVERASIDEAFLDLTEAVDKRILSDTQVSAEHLQNTYVVGYESHLGNKLTFYKKNLHYFCHNFKENKDEGRIESLQEWLQKAASSRHETRLMVAAKLVEEMRAAILSQTGFTCSAGIAHNKVFYYTCSD
jgi:DNA polymerase eta